MTIEQELKKKIEETISIQEADILRAELKGIQEGKREAIKILREVENSNTCFLESRNVESFVELAIKKIEEKR